MMYRYSENGVKYFNITNFSNTRYDRIMKYIITNFGLLSTVTITFVHVTDNNGCVVVGNNKCTVFLN
jgi:hypothetical protein